MRLRTQFATGPVTFIITGSVDAACIAEFDRSCTGCRKSANLRQLLGEDRISRTSIVKSVNTWQHQPDHPAVLPQTLTIKGLTLSRKDAARERLHFVQQYDRART
jgi:hypothetical protein